MHCWLSFCGQLYAKTDILRRENDYLLDNLEEGIVIFEEDTGDVVFKNKSVNSVVKVGEAAGSENTILSSQRVKDAGPIDRCAK